MLSSQYVLITRGSLGKTSPEGLENYVFHLSSYLMFPIGLWIVFLSIIKLETEAKNLNLNHKTREWHRLDSNLETCDHRGHAIVLPSRFETPTVET